jgi:PAS domain S-box-containing protein
MNARAPQQSEDENLAERLSAALAAAEQAAAAAADSEASYRLLFDSIDEGFCVVQVIFDEQERPVDYRFLEANPAFVAQSGLAGAVGRTAREMVPRLEDDWFEVYGRVAATGEPVRFQNGSEPMGRWFDVFAFRVGEPADRRVAILFTDATAAHHAARERERLVAEASAERERLRAVILSMPAPLALLAGPEHRFELVNDAYRRVSGGGRDVTGLTPAEAFPELQGKGMFERFDRVYATAEPWAGPETLVSYDRDGTGVQDTWFDLHFEPVLDAEGRVSAIINFAVDVTDQVRARQQVERLLGESERARVETEAARREAERSAQVTSTITTHLAEGVCMMDGGGRLTYMNPAAERILGWTAGELRGSILHDRVHYKRPDGRPYPIEECPLGRALTAGEPVLGMEDQWIRKDGSFVHLVTSCAPITEDGRVVGAVLSLHDDTERRRAEAERERLLAEAQRARTDAEDANRAKSQFLAVMSHELRTPLNAIGGYAELLEMGIRGPVTQQQLDDLRRIQHSQRHLLGLINEVLNYAKLETGTVHFDIGEVPVRGALVSAESLVAPQARAKGLTLSVADCPADLAVRADAEKLRQILVNLLSNAVKFTDSGGRVDVRFEPRGGSLAVEVADTGIGIPADKLEAIFDPFVQVRSDLTRPHEGTGLGLAISRDLARGMAGDLTARSAPGEGSVFTLTLPAA